MGGGIAWVAPRHGRNRYERSSCEHSHSVTVRGKPCPEAITAGSFPHSDAFGMHTFDGSKVWGVNVMFTICHW